MMASASNVRAWARMRSSSVAITTRDACRTLRAMRQTLSSIETPATTQNGLPGKRDEAYRAGITMAAVIGAPYFARKDFDCLDSMPSATVSGKTFIRAAICLLRRPVMTMDRPRITPS